MPDMMPLSESGCGFMISFPFVILANRFLQCPRVQYHYIFSYQYFLRTYNIIFIYIQRMTFHDCTYYLLYDYRYVCIYFLQQTRHLQQSDKHLRMLPSDAQSLRVIQTRPNIVPEIINN